jgi:predicted O-methyltransferase YrrM
MIDEPLDVPATVMVAQKCSAEVGFAMACENRTGALLRTLAASKPGGRILELGTGTGVGAAWLLAGMDPTARLTTVEIDWATQAVARGVVGDDLRAEFVVDDARRWLAAYDGPPFDLVYVDCRPGKFVDRHLLLGHLAAGGLYVGDDLLPQPTWPADHQPRVDAFVADIVAEPDLVVTLMRWASGLVVAARRSVRDGVDEPAGTLGEQVVGDGLPDRGGLDGRTAPAGLQAGGAVRAVDRAPQRQLPVAVEDGVPGDRAVAMPAQRPQHGPFRGGGLSGLPVVEPLGQRRGRLVVGADLQDDHARPDRRNDRVDRQNLGDAVGLVNALQAGHGQDQHIDLATVQLRQPCVDVAAHRRKPQVRKVPGDLRPPPHRTGPHRPVRGQVGELAAIGGDHAVVDVFTVQVGGERQALGDRHVAGDVLQTVHRDVDLVVEQRTVDLTDERALATGSGQRSQPPVTVGGDGDQLAGHGQRRRHPARLGQGHRAAPGADSYRTSLGAHASHSTTPAVGDRACTGHKPCSTAEASRPGAPHMCPPAPGSRSRSRSVLRSAGRRGVIADGSGGCGDAVFGRARRANPTKIVNVAALAAARDPHHTRDIPRARRTPARRPNGRGWLGVSARLAQGDHRG